MALNQIDLIENCEILCNLVVPDSVVKYLNTKNIQTFHAMRNTLEIESRHIHYCYNDNIMETVVLENESYLQGKGLDFKLMYKAFKTFHFYFNHLAGLTETNKVMLLTESTTQKQVYNQICSDFKAPELMQYVIDVQDFIQSHHNKFPELANFMGFTDEDQQDLGF